MVGVLISGKDKAKLQQRINEDELSFVKEAAELVKYKCVYCDKLAIYNYTAACQHLYCNKCHGRVNGKPCVVEGCSKTIGEDTKDKLKDQEIAMLDVFCAYSNKGCLEYIALHNFLEHVKTCKFAKRNLLPKLYKENEFVAYKEKTNEEISKLREANSDLESKIEQLKQQLLDLKNDNGIMEEVSKLSKSLKTDLSSITTIVSSQTNELKKEMQDFRGEIKKMVEDKISDVLERQAVKHIKQQDMMGKLESDIKQGISTLQEKFTKSEETIAHLVDEKIATQLKGEKFEKLLIPTEFHWIISGIGQTIKDWKTGVNKEILSDKFTTKDYGYTMQCKLVYEFQQRAFTILFQVQQDAPESVPAIYHHQRSFWILDQSRFGENHVWRMDTPGFGSTQSRTWMSGYHNDTWMVPLQVLGGKSSFIQNDRIMVRILIEPLALVYKSVFSKNGTLFWKLDNYIQRKQDYIDGVAKVLRSPSFYTHERGYRVHLGLHVRNFDISFYLSFNKGEFDDILPPSYPHQATLTILTQAGQQKHECMTYLQKSNDTTSNLITMITTKELESPEFLQDDSILIKLNVE